MDKKKIFNWSITVALAGFLFGFDTVVISGANLPIKELWSTTPLFHGVFIMSMALWGTVLGSLFGSIPCDRIGRKNTLIWIGIQLNRCFKISLWLLYNIVFLSFSRALLISLSWSFNFSIVLTDPEGIISISLGAYGVPETYLLNNESKIIKKYIGPLTNENILEIIKIIK